MKRFTFTFFFLCIFLLVGCKQNKYNLSPKDPVTITIWHNYGGIMQKFMDSLIDSFNNTKGREQGITVSITSINSTKSLQNKLLQIINDDPGAPELPDITTCYPQIAILLHKKNFAVDLYKYIDKSVINEYVPSFIKEGEIDNKLFVLPIAKSSEVLYLNKTLFDRFASECDVSFDDLATFEGICKCADKYKAWSGKPFFTADSYYNLYQTGLYQYGKVFASEETLSLDTSSKEYTYIDNLLRASIKKGGIVLYNGYSSDLSKTGEIICSIGSTAGILFYGDKITYSDNTTENVEFEVLPYPIFKNANKKVLQRGNGMTVINRGDDQESIKKQYAAAIFLQWFTQIENNLQFISGTGYLPVKIEAFNQIIDGNMPDSINPQIKKLLKTSSIMQKTYEFYFPPIFEEFDSISKKFNQEYYLISD